MYATPWSAVRIDVNEKEGKASVLMDYESLLFLLVTFCASGTYVSGGGTEITASRKNECRACTTPHM